MGTDLRLPGRYGFTDHPNCSVCMHKDVEIIHRALARGENKSKVAKRYGLTYAMIHGHIEKGHLGQLVEIAHRDGRITRLADLMDATRATAEETLDIMRAESDKKCYSCGRGGDADVKLRAVDRLHRSIELAGKLTGQLQAPTIVQFIQQIGAASEQEVREAVKSYRSDRELNIEDAFEDALQLIVLAIRKKPELQSIALSKIGAQVMVTNGKGLTNGV